MATFGLGNFMYDLTVDGGKAVFKFYDAQDADNTAEVSLSTKDMDGFDADSRQVADKAYAQVSKVLNDKRDSRLAKEAQQELNEKQAEDARVREAGEDFLNKAEDVKVAPAQVEEDGTHVFNTAEASDASSDNSSKKNK